MKADKIHSIVAIAALVILTINPASGIAYADMHYTNAMLLSMSLEQLTNIQVRI